MTDRQCAWAAGLLATAYFFVLWFTADAIGFVRDEGYYFKAAREYAGWWSTVFSSRFFDAFTDAEIVKHFSYNTEHPALVKLTLGITHALLHDFLGLASNAQAYRATGFLFGALSLWATFLLGRDLFDAKVGLLAAACLAVMPRFFFDAHLACFDVPVTAMWTFSLWSFWRAYRATGPAVIPWAVVAGLLWGLAVATKHNSLFLPFIFVAVWLYDVGWRRWLRPVRGPSGGLDFELPRIPLVLVVSAILGPLVFLAHWPYLWHDTVARIGSYFAFHLHHEHYPALYFQALLVSPPFPVSFPFVMSAFTIPVPIFFAGVIGLAYAVYRAVFFRDTAMLVLSLATLVPTLLIAAPTTPVFGGVKHWYNALPAFSVLAAAVALWAGRTAWPRFRPALMATIVVFVLAPGVLGISATHPNGIASYNALAGGVRGAAEMGFQRAFWGGLARPLLPRVASDGRARVFFNRMNYDSYLMYRKDGEISNDVAYANKAKSADAAFHFVQPEHGEQECEIWSRFGSKPTAGVYQDNVDLVQMYDKAGR